MEETENGIFPSLVYVSLHLTRALSERNGKCRFSVQYGSSPHFPLLVFACHSGSTESQPRRAGMNFAAR
jgi:hypothetical protein